MARWGRKRIVWSVLGALVVTCVALWFWRGSHFVRTETREILETQLAGLLRGEVHIDSVEQLSFGHVVARGVTLLDPQKRVVLTARRLRLDLDLSELPSGIRFSHGHMTDARIRSIPSDDAGISLFEAFLPRDETPGDPSASPFRVTFDDIRIERAQVYGDFPGFSNIRITDVTAGARIAVARGLDVHVASVGGTFVAPFSSPVKIEAARTNIVIANELMRIAARAQLSRGTERLGAVLAYRLPLAEGAKDLLDLRLELAPVTPEWVREIGLSLPQTLYGELRGPVHLWGPRDHLRFDVSLETAGGPLLVRGELPVGGTSRVHVESPRLSLPEVLAYAPPVSLGLTVDVDAPFEGPVQIRGAAPFVDVLGFTATDATLKGEYENGTFRILDAVLDYADGHFRISGAVDENADFDLRVKSDIPDTRKDPTLRATGFDAAIHADIRLSRKGDDMTAEGRIALENAHYEGVSAKQLVMEGHAEILNDDYAKPVLHVRGRAAALSIPGLVDGAVTLGVDGKAGHYTSNLSIQDPRGRSLTARASLTELARGYRIQADPLILAVSGREPWRAQADVVVHDEGIELRNVHLASGPQRLELSGTYSYSQAYGVDATLQAFDVGGLRELLGIDLADLDGTVDGELHLTGVPGQPRIDAQGSLRHGVFLGMTDLTVLLSMVFVENRFDVETEVQLPDGSRVAIYAGGEPGRGATWGTQIENGNYQFGLDFEQLPFEVTRPWLSWLGLEPPGGKVSAMVRGAGTLEAPTLELTSRVEKLAIGTYAPIDLDVALKHDSQVLELERLQIDDAEGELVTLSGTIEAELGELFNVNGLRASLDTRPFDLRMRVPPRRLDALPAPLTLEDYPFYASGELELVQTDAGPSITLSSRVGWPRELPGLDACGLERHAELVMLLRAQGMSANLETTVLADADTIGSITASARPDVTAWLTGREAPHLLPTQVEARLNALATEELPVLCRYVAGPLRAELFAGDIFATPPELRFLVESGSLQLVPRASQTQRLGNLRTARTVGRAFKLSASGGVERERVSFTAQIDQGNGSSLSAFGAVPRAAFVPKEKRRPGLEPIEARLVATRFELSPVLLALPLDVRAGGRLDGNMRFAYGLDNEQVELEGALDLSAGQLALAALGQELSDLTATLRMKGNTLRITDLETHDFDGKLSAEGAIVFTSLTEILGELSFDLDEFPLRREGIQVSKVTGKVDMRTEIGSERARAELDLSNLRVDLPQELDTSLQPLDEHPDIVVKGQAPRETPEHPYVIDLRIHANPPFRIRRTDLSADVIADLDVHYADPALALQGSAELKRGSFELYGKRFELDEGRVAFDGGEDIDPLVSLYAIHKIGSDEIGVRVEGRLSSPTVTFTHSDPSITDTGEIIAQLLGGRRDESSNSNQDASGAAANMLAGATAGLLTQEVRNKFGGNLPVLSFESGNQAFNNARIRAGVQLDTFVEKRLGPLRHVVRGAYIEGFVSPGAGTDSEQRSQSTVPQSRGGGLLELRFPRDFVGTVEYRPVQNWRLDVAWEP